MRKAASIIITGLIIIFAAASILFSLSAYTGKDAIPNVFGYCPMVVVSGSMEPTLMTNDMIISKVVPQEACEIGDIIIYRREGEYIIHRLIGKHDTLFITKGDANFTEDPPFTGEDVVGKYVIKVPLVGHILLFIKDTIGEKALFFSQIALLLILIYVGYMTYKRRKGYEKNIH